MSNDLKNWAIIILCMHCVAALWFAASPTRLGHWFAAMDIAYDSIWIEHVGDCDCTQPLE